MGVPGPVLPAPSQEELLRDLMLLGLGRGRSYIKIEVIWGILHWSGSTIHFRGESGLSWLWSRTFHIV